LPTAGVAVNHAEPPEEVVVYVNPDTLLPTDMF
jgi:hypothetical protein